MKHKSTLYEIIVFSLIMLFLVIPPFFSPAVTSETVIFSWNNLPVKQFILFAFALVIYIFYDKYLHTRIHRYFFPSFRALGGLFFITLIIRFIVTRYSITEISQPIPRGGQQWLCCLFTFAFSAAYEEIIYRFYLPGIMIRLFRLKFDSKFFVFLSEFLAAVLFAFAHLYLGWISVINAFLAHLILRWLYKDTGLIWNGVFIHVIYNIISLILL